MGKDKKAKEARKKLLKKLDGQMEEGQGFYASTQPISGQPAGSSDQQEPQQQPQKPQSNK